MSTNSHRSREWEKIEMVQDDHLSPLINRIRDILYSIKKSPKEIFLENTDGAGLMKMNDFSHMIGKYSLNKITRAQAEEAFLFATHGKSQLTLSDFETAFK